jgi:hypothetical protein
MTKTKKSFCTVRKDLLEKELGVPVGDVYYSEAESLPYRWSGEEEDKFEVLYEGKWQEAYSIDFEFN